MKKIYLSFISCLLLCLSVNSCRLEDCGKTFLITGKVVDQSNIPIADVKIRWHYSDASIPEMVLGYTGSNGIYSISHENHGGLRGASIEFVKSGFATQVSTSYSENEAGSGLCGNITLTRDVILSL